MRLLYLTYDGLSDPLGGSQILPYLIGLSKLHHEISVISFEKGAVTEPALNWLSRQCAEQGIDWHPMRYHKHPPVLSTAWDVAAMRVAADRLHRRKAFDLVHCRSYVPALAGLDLKRRHGVRFLFDMRGFWPDERVEGGRWNLRNPLFRAVYRYFKRKERYFLAEADAIVSLTRAARYDMLALPSDRRPTVDPQVIPCCVDLSLFDLPGEDRRQAVRAALGIAPDAPVLCYLGSLGGNYLLEEMLRFFVAYRGRMPGSRFLFVTREPAGLIVETAAKLGIASEELIVRSVGRSEVPALVSAADHGVGFKRATHAEKACSPTKLGEMMALGIPVAVNAGIGDVEAIIADTAAGTVVDGFDRQSMEKGVDRLIGLGASVAEIRAGAQRWFDLEKGISAYDSIYRSLTSH